jgi:signal transduction histidine kinase
VSTQDLEQPGISALRPFLRLTYGAPSLPAVENGLRLLGPRLRLLGVVAPAAFVGAVGVADVVLEGQGWWSSTAFGPWRVALLLALAGCVVGFALMMFRLIDRTQSYVLRQNRDLLASHAVSIAIQGRQGADAIVEAATRALLETSGASHVRIRLDQGGDPAGVARATAPTLDLPLANGTETVGRLELWYPADTKPGDRIDTSTLATLGTQVAYAVQLAQAVEDLHRGRDEGFAFYDVLVKISNQSGTLPTLTAIAAHARQLLHADAGAIVINVATANSVRFDSDTGAPESCADGTSVLGVGLPDHFDDRTGARVNPIGCYHWKSESQRAINASAGMLGTLWVGRRSGGAFTHRDQAFLATMAGLASIALTSAQLRETGRQSAILSERTRIARETHDSHAQVLGAMHLRLRALEASTDLRSLPAVRSEVSTLADICEEAYADVREVILALRDADKPERGLEESLRDYLQKYTAVYDVRADFVNAVGGRVVLSPRAESELIRVVQEALTNVRKHANATRATVTVTGTDASTTFTIADDGIGFATPHAAGPTDGYGLVTMRERIMQLGGTLEITSAPRRGTRVVATIPERPTLTGGHKAS